jgi:hypothetical protein
MDALSLTIEAEMLGLYQPPPPILSIKKPKRGPKRKVAA